MLISARMLEIVKHLYQYKTTTYKEIEQSLGIKEMLDMMLTVLMKY